MTQAHSHATSSAFKSYLESKAITINPLESIESDLPLLENALVALLPLKTQSSRDISAHIFSSGGKRIRPSLFFLTCQMLGYRGPHYIPIGCVCEYVHTASLLHDDVVDNSSLRRGKPTAKSIWGDESSVLVGDLIYARASELMAETNHLEIVTTFARAICLMSEGELLQLENVFNTSATRENYFRIIEYKTAVLLEASCKAAGILAESSLPQKDALALFGKNLGIAFQLIDDALDFSNDSDLLGKKILADLSEGKITLPLILLREQSSPNEWATVETLIAAFNETPSDEGKAFIQVKIMEKQIISQVMEIAEEHTAIALKQLDIFDGFANVEHLRVLAHELLSRVS